MIQVVISKKGDTINSIEIKGHAKSGAYGHDLVCAAVSSIAIGTLNAIDQMFPNSCLLEMNDEVMIKVKKCSEGLNYICLTCLYQLMTVEAQYSQYIKIEKIEVKS